ncbi:MAG: APC family permease [Solirubrobacteraceae bacterium]|nr:APC family permease [Solirubrobacteraceae bacterium]
MSTIAQPPGAAMPQTAPAPTHKLAPGALGLTSVLFCIVTGAAPLAAMMFNVPITVLGSGFAAPAAFLVATIALTIFSVGYIEMSQRVTAAGGFYTFVTRGLGKELGMGAAILIALCYIIFAAAVMGSLGFFASTTINEWTGLDLPGWFYSFLGLAIISAFAFFHIETSAKILGVALCGEIIILTILAVAVIVQGGENGLTLAPLNPVELFDNETAVSAFGASAVGIAIFGAFWSWVGFEMAPNYAEESRDPKKIAKTATYGSVIGLGLFYIFISWVFVIAWGTEGVGAGVGSYFAGEIASPFYPITDSYVGGGLTTAFQALIVTGSFACAMAFYNTSARYLYSLARERALPSVLGKTHPTRHSPHVASLAVTAMVGLYMLGFTIYDSSTEASLLKLGTWSPLLGVLGILFVQALASVAIIRFFLTDAKDGFHPWKTLIAPILGTLLMLGACYLLIKYRADLSAAGDVPFIKYLPWVCTAMFVAGVVLAFAFKYGAKDRYDNIGSFEHDDASVHERLHAGGPFEPAGA